MAESDIAITAGTMGYEVTGAYGTVTEAQRKSWATNAAYTNMYANNILESLMAKVITPKFMRHENLAGMPTKQMKFPKASKHTAAALVEGVEMSNTVLLSDSVTIDTGEVGIMSTVTNVLEKSDLAQASAARSQQLGKAMADKLDIDNCTLYGNLSQSIGSASTSFTQAQLLSIIYKLEALDACDIGSGLVGVIHPEQTDDFRTNLTSNASNGIGQLMRYGPGETAQFGAAMRGYFGTWYGVDLFQTTNVQSGTNLWEGAIFNSNYTFAMVTKEMTRMETMWWGPLRAVAYMAVSWYGVGEIEDKAGYLLKSQKAA